MSRRPKGGAPGRQAAPGGQRVSPPRPGRRPLFDPLATRELERERYLRELNGNAGLWYDKYCDQWCRDPQRSGLEAWSLETFTTGEGKERKTIRPQSDWIATVCGIQVGDPRLLDEAARRRVALLAAFDRSPLVFATDWRFVTALGREHPVENGFAWHHTLGVPYLPGSSVKGMIRAYVEAWLYGAERSDAQASDVKRIFGPRSEKDGAHAAGSVLFLDALPIKPVQLEEEVMTPHYAPYYQGDQPPADWHSPVPIPFLAVTTDQEFLFGLLPRGELGAGAAGDCSRKDCDKAAAWLGQALEQLGAGAKTAVGYGRFRAVSGPAEHLQHEAGDRQEAERLEGLSPEQRVLEELRRRLDEDRAAGRLEPGGPLAQKTAELLQSAGSWPPAGRVALAELATHVYDFIGWGSGSKKRQRRARIEELRRSDPHPPTAGSPEPGRPTTA